jgi:uncharacterized membrane protein YgcG
MLLSKGALPLPPEGTPDNSGSTFRPRRVSLLDANLARKPDESSRATVERFKAEHAGKTVLRRVSAAMKPPDTMIVAEGKMNSTRAAKTIQGLWRKVVDQNRRKRLLWRWSAEMLKVVSEMHSKPTSEAFLSREASSAGYTPDIVSAARAFDMRYTSTIAIARRNLRVVLEDRSLHSLPSPSLLLDSVDRVRHLRYHPPRRLVGAALYGDTEYASGGSSPNSPNSPSSNSSPSRPGYGGHSRRMDATRALTCNDGSGDGNRDGGSGKSYDGGHGGGHGGDYGGGRMSGFSAHGARSNADRGRRGHGEGAQASTSDHSDRRALGRNDGPWHQRDRQRDDHGLHSGDRTGDYSEEASHDSRTGSPSSLGSHRRRSDHGNIVGKDVPFDPYRAPSIWVPRIAWSDGKDLYDTPATWKERFFHDWRRALHKGIIGIIMRWDDDGLLDQDGDGVPDEITDVCHSFWRHCATLTSLFFYYSASNPVSGNVLMVSLNEYTQMIEDLRLISKKLKRSYFDRLFIEVNMTREKLVELQESKDRSSKAPPTSSGMDEPTSVVASEELFNEAGARPVGHKFARSNSIALRSAEELRKAEIEKKVDVYNNDRQLTRVEFFVVILKIALEKYIRFGVSHGGATVDASKALDQLLDEDVCANLGRRLPIADDFRREVCYTGPVNGVLRKHEPSLRRLFDGLALVGKVRKHVPRSLWKALLQTCGFIATDVSLREVMLIFVWSRMVVHDGQSPTGRVKETCLSFEGFLEAICRLSALKALPTDEMVAAAAVADAGAYVMQLQDGDANVYAAFLNDQSMRIEWGGEVSDLREPMHRRVEHMITLLFREIKHFDRKEAKEADKDVSRLQEPISELDEKAINRFLTKTLAHKEYKDDF